MSGTKTKTIQFYECEHQGDLDSYTEDLIACGIKVISESVNHEAELGTVQIEYTDEQWQKFINTNAYEYLN